MERNKQNNEDISKYAGDLIEETDHFMQEAKNEKNEGYDITISTGFLTIFCC